MSNDQTIPKGMLRFYPPEGGDPVFCREDQAPRYVRNGWRKTNKPAAKPASEGDKS